MESTRRGDRGSRRTQGLRRRVRRYRRKAWERREQRYYRRHSAEVDASLRHSHLRQLAPRHSASHQHHAPGTASRVRHSTAREPAPGRLLTAALVAPGAAGGAVAGCHPTGTPVVDPVETALFAAAFTLLVSRAAPRTWLVVGITAVFLARGWLLGPAALTLVVALAGLFVARLRPWAGTVVGALGVQVALRWPAHFFHGFPAAVAGALVLVSAASAWPRSSRSTRRRAKAIVGGVAAVGALCSLALVVATLLVRSDALRGESAARTALADAGNENTTAIVADLTTATKDTSDAARVIDSWITAGARAVPVEAQQQRFLAGVLRAASSAATVGRREASALDPRFGSQPGRIDLDRLEGLATPMRVLDRQLHATDTQLSSLGSPWLVGPLQDRAASFRRQVAQAIHTADLGVQATNVVPGMLGADGPRRYLIAFMTPSESRGYDGLIGSYGLLTADAGHLSLTASGNITNVQDALPKGGAHVTGVPDYLARYGAFAPGTQPEDVMYSPDLPTDAKVFAQVYEQSLGGPVDGVLAIDPYGLAALLHFTGSVQVPGLPFPLTEANAAKVLLTEEYTRFDAGLSNGDVLRRDFLESALHAAFSALVNGSLPAPQELSTVLDPVAAAGRISFWSFHPGEQPFLGHLGIDGSFPKADGGDLLAVTTQNTGNNKIDAYLHTAITDRVSFDPGTGAEHSEVQVTLRNDAPARGLPPVIIANPGDPGLTPGINETWLTIYSPLSFDQVTVDGTPASMSATRELGVWAYSAYVDVAPGASVTVRVGLLGTAHAGSTLRTSVRLQPSANPVSARLVVTPSGPWTVAGDNDPTRWDLGPAMDQSRVFHFVKS